MPYAAQNGLALDGLISEHDHIKHRRRGLGALAAGDLRDGDLKCWLRRPSLSSRHKLNPTNEINKTLYFVQHEFFDLAE
jgi:hypothetical protein